jgi:hypothetical protein
MENKKPLFIPLKTEHYEAFQSGMKFEELRVYGPRWNERTCWIGRDVVLSKGYGKKHRMKGKICGFVHRHCDTLSIYHRCNILNCYGSAALLKTIAVIGIDSLEVIDGSKKKAGC